MCVKTGLILLAILAATPSAWAATCSGPPRLEANLHAHPDADAYASLGKWFGEHHELDCAAQAFQSGLRLHPDSAQLAYLLGLSLFTAGKMQESVAPLQQSVQLYPQEIKSHLLLAAAFNKLGRDSEALPEWETAFKIDSTSKEALDGLAKTLISLGDYESVISRLSSVPRDESLTFDLAIAEGDAGRADDAEQVLIGGIGAYPDSDRLTAFLVATYVREGRLKEAAALAEKLVRRKPQDIEAQRIYLRALVVNTNPDVAVSLGHKLLAVAPHDPEILKLTGMLERLKGDYPAARKHLEQAVALSPNDFESRSTLGIVLVQLNDPAGAREQLQKALDLGATEPEVHFELAKALRALGQTREAQEQIVFYQKGVKEKADRLEATYKAMQAEQALKAGDSQKAADLYRQACALLPDDPKLAYGLAHALDDLGNIAAERAALEQAIKADPGFAPAYYQLGYLDFQAGDNAAAERRFRQVVNITPSYFEAWVSLAETLGEQSRFQEAHEAVAAALKLKPEDAGALELRKSLDAELRAH
jgi:Flp pilus assembly protein TadD